MLRQTTDAPTPQPGDVVAMLVPADLIADLRSDHAGETGAVFIYRGILALSRDPAVCAFAMRHLHTERRHLALMQQLLPAGQVSRLLPLWRVAGWLTGALPALFGRRAVFVTIDAVETFVDRHYAEQIVRLQGRPEYRGLLALLEGCRQDEIAHRDDARAHVASGGMFGRIWTQIVDRGSQLGVRLARRL